MNTWEEFDQTSIIPPAVFKSDFNNFSFAKTGPPSEWSGVHGYDETSYNGNTAAIDVFDVAGVFGGWTASDIVLNVEDAASLVYDVYGSEHKLISKGLVEQMYTASNETGYGLATFNLTRNTGVPGEGGVAYGHLGATYGYQSIVAYSPAYDFALSIATNIERDEQEQPSDTMCSVFNAVAAVVQGQDVPTCKYSRGSYYGGGCKCSNMPTPAPGPAADKFHCKEHKCTTSLFGKESKEDCEKNCN